MELQCGNESSYGLSVVGTTNFRYDSNYKGIATIGAVEEVASVNFSLSHTSMHATS